MLAPPGSDDEVFTDGSLAAEARRRRRGRRAGDRSVGMVSRDLGDLTRASWSSRGPARSVATMGRAADVPAALRPRRARRCRHGRLGHPLAGRGAAGGRGARAAMARHGHERRKHVRQTIREDHESRIAAARSARSSPLATPSSADLPAVLRDMGGEDAEMPTAAVGDVHPTVPVPTRAIGVATSTGLRAPGPGARRHRLHGRRRTEGGLGPQQARIAEAFVRGRRVAATPATRRMTSGASSPGRARSSCRTARTGWRSTPSTPRVGPRESSSAGSRAEVTRFVADGRPGPPRRRHAADVCQRLGAGTVLGLPRPDDRGPSDAAGAQARRSRWPGSCDRGRRLRRADQRPGDPSAARLGASS